MTKRSCKKSVDAKKPTVRKQTKNASTKANVNTTEIDKWLLECKEGQSVRDRLLSLDRRASRIDSESSQSTLSEQSSTISSLNVPKESESFDLHRLIEEKFHSSITNKVCKQMKWLSCSIDTAFVKLVNCKESSEVVEQICDYLPSEVDFKSKCLFLPAFAFYASYQFKTGNFQISQNQLFLFDFDLIHEAWLRQFELRLNDIRSVQTHKISSLELFGSFRLVWNLANFHQKDRSSVGSETVLEAHLELIHIYQKFMRILNPFIESDSTEHLFVFCLVEYFYQTTSYYENMKEIEFGLDFGQDLLALGGEAVIKEVTDFIESFQTKCSIEQVLYIYLWTIDSFSSKMTLYLPHFLHCIFKFLASKVARNPDQSKTSDDDDFSELKPLVFKANEVHQLMKAIDYGKLQTSEMVALIRIFSVSITDFSFHDKVSLIVLKNVHKVFVCFCRFFTISFRPSEN